MNNNKYQTKLSRYIANLNNLLDEVKQEFPDAEFYLANDMFHLMSGPSHDDNEKPHQERSIACATIYSCGGGDW